MTFANIDGLLLLGILLFSASLWLLLKGAPVPVKIRKKR